MSYITLKCKNCGAGMTFNTESHSATCAHCSSTFLLSELLDEKDVAFMSKFSKEELEQKMIASDMIKQGENFLAQCNYEKAESAFKKAIEHDDSNYRSYFGVVKAKTQNFNKLPDNDDYVQYAHYAQSLATGDDLVLVNSELSKLDLLTREKRRQKKIYASILKQEEINKIKRREVNNVFTIISIFIVLMIIGFLFVGSMVTNIFFYKPNKEYYVNVDSYEKLSRVLSNEKYLDYNITLTNDIDCEGNSLSPLGTSTNAFTGTFNGNNHKISNAVIETNNNYAGLFGCTILATIKNVVLDNVSLTVSNTPKNSSDSFYGFIAGKSEATSIFNIEIKNTCQILVEKNLDYQTSIGGVVGSMTNACFVSQISSHAKITANLTYNKSVSSHLGGIAGTIKNSIVQKTCSNGDLSLTVIDNGLVSSNAYISGIIGKVLSSSNKDILNITHNNFSGKASLNVSSIVNPTISAISSHGTTTSKPLHNACLFTSANFTLNSNPLISSSSLNDYNMNENFVKFCTSNDTYLNYISQSFSGWDNNNTFEPSLKII